MEEQFIIETLDPRQWDRDILRRLLAVTGSAQDLLCRRAAAVKAAALGPLVYYRGLIEFSNICAKDCYYCGIRHGNAAVDRYTLTDAQILDAARFAIDNQYGSLVLQSGEQCSAVFVARITNLLRAIKKRSDPPLGITLSCGEQTREVYAEWRAAGAHRYLLRIETANPSLYQRLHPDDGRHRFDRRLECLRDLRTLGYQTGTGVMIGLPGQSVDDLAGDLLFMRDFDVDMVGMGPYIEHAQTPLTQWPDPLLPRPQRLDLALKMIALLRLMMPDINIAATTAMQTIDPRGREKALQSGANVVMPNITPRLYRRAYALYEDKPCQDEDAADCLGCLQRRIEGVGQQVGYGQWGDSRHFFKRQGPAPEGDGQAMCS